ncbi:hypothetical protein TNCV_4529781 [Trichonephila clavipes]|nr:hypothetical protein TNCV_4529781 [Trichonephila clavipes]
MFSVRVAELCPASGVCPVVCRQNIVQHQGYDQWPVGRTLSNVRGLFSVRMAELCSVSGVCPVSLRQNSVQRQGGMSSARVAELCPSSERCPASGGMSSGRGSRTPSVLRQGGMSSVRVAELCPALGVCPVSAWQNAVLRQGYVQRPEEFQSIFTYVNVYSSE